MVEGLLSHQLTNSTILLENTYFGERDEMVDDEMICYFLSYYLSHI